MAGRPIRTTPKGTVVCAVCGERRSIAGVAYARRPGYAHRGPVCGRCRGTDPATAERRARFDAALRGA
jgi:hypothetical protein